MTPGVESIDVPLFEMQTIYARVGDLFAWTCIAAVGLVGDATALARTSIAYRSRHRYLISIAPLRLSLTSLVPAGSCVPGVGVEVGARAVDAHAEAVVRAEVVAVDERAVALRSGGAPRRRFRRRDCR